MARCALKAKVYEYIQTKDEGVTAIHLQEIFQVNLHQISGALIKLRNEGKIGKVHGEGRGAPNLWVAHSKFQMAGLSKK